MHEQEHLHIFTFILCIHTYVYLAYPVVHHLYSCFLLRRIHMQCKHMFTKRMRIYAPGGLLGQISGRVCKAVLFIVKYHCIYIYICLYIGIYVYMYIHICRYIHI